MGFCSCRRTQPVLAVIPEMTAHEVWESAHAGAAKAAYARTWRIYWNGPTREDDYVRQIQIVQQEIERGVAGLILSPDHAVALISPVHAALAQGIPTVIIGSPLGIEPGGKLSYVLNDDAAAGRMAAERAKRYLHRGDTVAVIGTNPDFLGSIDRAVSFEAALRREYPEIEIYEPRGGSFLSAESDGRAELAIRLHPRLRVVFTQNIEQTELIHAVLERTHKANRIKLIACDQDLGLMRMLRRGEIDAVLAERTYEMGARAVEIIARLREGAVPETKVLLPPALITRENIDSPAMQQVLDMNWRVQ